MYLHYVHIGNGKVHVDYNFNCRIENEGFLKVTGSHLHCKSDNIPETVQDRDVVTTAIGSDL